MNSEGSTIGRRTFVRGATAAAIGGVSGTVPAAAQPAESDFEAWFQDVDNYDGIVDRTGESTVEIAVGAAGNGGAFAFDPAAVRVDPGTTVTWRWTGDGGSHDVAAADDTYGSAMQSTEGTTFEHTFEQEGVSYYVCTPHEGAGMKGAVVVGDVSVGPAETVDDEIDYGGWFDGVDNFDGTVDATGQEEVRIGVGTDGDGVAPAFDPAAVHVDPGTTVVWEVAGDGEAHTVVAEEGDYESDELTEAGSTFALTFDGDGVSEYYCERHRDAGMRGAVVVGAGPSSKTVLTPLGKVTTGGALLALLYGVYGHFKETMESTTPGAERPDAT